MNSLKKLWKSVFNIMGVCSWYSIYKWKKKWLKNMFKMLPFTKNVIKACFYISEKDEEYFT